MSLESSKSLGVVGAILMLLGVFSFGIPYISILGLVGFILILAALHGLGRYYNENGIFSNAIYGFIIGIVGTVVTAIVAVIVVLSNLTSIENFLVQIFPTWTKGDWRALSGMRPTIPSSIDWSPLGPLIAGLVAAFVIFVVFAVVSAYFFRRSFKLLSVKSTVGLFSTAGLLLLIGAALLIAALIPGVIVIWIAILLLAIAFFQMQPMQASTMTTAPAPSKPA
ncbi:MAG: DUF996 domain-containing protein [Candidatus Bathyarchaeia archaeon]|jgi:uncharacterized membrane protein